MKFLADAGHLGAVTSALAGMIPPNTLFPILATIKMEAQKDSVIFTATSMDCLATITMPAKVIEAGNVAIEAERLNAFADGLTGQVAIDTTAQGATAKCNKRNAKLAILPPEEFPALPFEGAAPVVEFDLSGEAVNVIADMIFATAQRDAARPYLSGVHIFTENKKLHAEAATGQVAIRYGFDVKCKIPDDRSIIIPRDTLPYLKRLFPDGCRLALTENKLQATDEAVRFVSKLVQGPYPSLQNLIPAASDELSIRCDAQEIATAAERVAAIAGGDTHWVTLFPRGDHVLLTAANKAEAEDIVTAECSGAIDQVTISTRIFGPLLATLGAETVRLTQNAAGTPIRVDPLAVSGRVGVVMPVRFRAEMRVAA